MEKSTCLATMARFTILCVVEFSQVLSTIGGLSSESMTPVTGRRLLIVIQ
jgi:hypothetical protein